MTKYTFTTEDVAREVTRLATESPDFVYTEQECYDNGCSYIAAAIGSTEGEGCIVGQAVQALGVSELDLIPHEGSSASMLIRKLLDTRVSSENHNRSRVETFIDDVQGEQDYGHSWGEALELAKKRFS